MLVKVNVHVLCQQLIPNISRRSAKCRPFSIFIIAVFFYHATFPIVNRGGYMNPMRRIFRVRFSSLHADTQPEPFAFVGTGLDYVWKRNYFSMWTIGQAGFITQSFQLPLYLFEIIEHIEKIKLLA